APSGADVPVAEHHVLLAGQAFQPYRAAGVQLVGGNADLRAQAVLEAVGETGGGVDHHRGGIHLSEEAPRIREVLGDDRVGVLRTVGVDVPDGRVQRVDDANRQDRRVVFGVPVVLAGFQHVIAEQRAGLGVAAQ